MTAWHVVNVPDEPYKVSGGGAERVLTFKRLGASDVAFSVPATLPPEWRVIKTGAAPEPKEDAILWGLPACGGLVSSRGAVRDRGSRVDYVVASRGGWATIDAPVWPGMSGGPALDASGSVFGVVSMARESVMTGIILATVAEIPGP